jgi:hypothetical protein
MRTATCFLAFIALAIQTLPAEAARNLLREGQFNVLPGSPGSPWSVSGNGTVLVGSGGYLGGSYPDAPSVRLRSEAEQSVSIQQCISVDLSPGTGLSFSVLGFVQASLGANGTAKASVAHFGSDVCVGPPVVGVVHEAQPRGLQPARFGALWMVEPFTLPSTTRSLVVTIRTEAGADAIRDFSWDNARLMLLNRLDTVHGARYWHQNSDGVGDSAEVDDGFGGALAAADFNGDGFDDLAIGVPFEDRTAFNVDYIDAGLVHVLYGGPHGLRDSGGQQLGAQAFAGLQGNARFGFALAAGDIDGDGYADLVIGSPGSSDDGEQGAGAIFVSWGSPTGLSGLQRLQQSSTQVGGTPLIGEGFGFSLAVGDVNADGHADIAIGVPGDGPNLLSLDRGAVYLLYGSADRLQVGAAPLAAQYLHQNLAGLPGSAVSGNRFGQSVLLHDLDADGHADLAVGVPFAGNEGSNAGMVFVLRGTSLGLTTSGNDQLLPSQFGQAAPGGGFFGAALGGGERIVGGQLHRSLLIGAPGISSPGIAGHGRAFRFSRLNSSPSTVLYEGIDQGPAPAEFPEQLDAFASAVAFADLDGDGLPDDEALGAPGEDSSAGSLHLRTVRDGLVLERALRQSNLGGAHEVGDRFGAVVARGNFNGRGGDELAIGVPGEGVGAIGGAGAVIELSLDPPPEELFANGFEAPLM